jgi:DnaJ-class molecular chaperone
VSKTASDNEIRSAYKKMVLKHHPDKNLTKDTTNKFQKIQIAYETLSDKNKRAQYDSFENMDNSNQIKNFFMIYQQLIIEVCEQYEINSEDRDILYNLFDPDEFDPDIDIEIIYTSMYTKLFNCGSQILLKKISEENPIIGYFCNLFM